MRYEFKSEILRAQSDAIMFAAFEGNNEIAIIDAGSNGQASYWLVVIQHDGKNEVALREQEYRKLADAFEGLKRFLLVKYSLD